MKELYDIRSQLISTVSQNIEKQINQYVNKHRKDIRYFLHYPLIAIELGLDSGVTHSISNENLRDTFGFLVKKTINEWEKSKQKKV